MRVTEPSGSQKAKYSHSSPSRGATLTSELKGRRRAADGRSPATSCRERLADASVDLVYLDPPFNSNRAYNVLFSRQGYDDTARSGS